MENGLKWNGLGFYRFFLVAVLLGLSPLARAQEASPTYSYTVDLTNPAFNTVNEPVLVGPYRYTLLANVDTCENLYAEYSDVANIFIGQNFCGSLANTYGAIGISFANLAGYNTVLGSAPSSVTFTTLTGPSVVLNGTGAYIFPDGTTEPIAPPPAPVPIITISLTYTAWQYTLSAPEGAACTINGISPSSVVDNTVPLTITNILNGAITVTQHTFSGSYQIPYQQGLQTFQVNCPNSYLQEVHLGDETVEGNFGNNLVVIYGSPQAPGVGVRPASSFSAAVSLIQSATLTIGAALPTLTVSASNLHVEQVVEDPVIPGGNGVDLVQGKSASFKVTLNGSGLQNATGSVKVQIMSGATQLTSTIVNVAAIAAAPGGNQQLVIPPNMFPSWVATGLSSPITVVLTPSSSGVTVNNSNPISVTANVHVIVPPKIGFTKVMGSSTCTATDGSCFGNPSVTNYTTLLQTNNFVSRAFPVSNGSVSYTDLSENNSIPHCQPPTKFRLSPKP
jgi:hypothetical protein